MTSGGENYIRSEYTKKKISIANTGRKFSDEHKKNLRKKRSPDAKKRMSDSAKQGGRKPPFRLGKHLTQEQKDRKSEQMKGKSTVWLSGRHLSDSHKKIYHLEIKVKI